MRNMLGRVRHVRRVQHPGGALGDVAIDLAGFDDARRAKQGPELRALGHVASQVDPPHQRGEFLILGEHQRDIARPACGSLGGKRLAGRRSLQHHRLVVVRHGRRGGENGPAAHRMTLEADIVLVDDVEAAQVRKAVGPAKAVGEGGRIAVAVAGLVEGEDHIAATGEFDRKAVLGLARVDIAVNGQNAGGRGLRGGVGRDVEQGAHGIARSALEAHILDPDTAGGLCEVRQQSAGQNENQSGNRPGPSAAHGSLPRVSRAVRPAFRFVLQVRFAGSFLL